MNVFKRTSLVRWYSWEVFIKASGLCDSNLAFHKVRRQYISQFRNIDMDRTTAVDLLLMSLLHEGGHNADKSDSFF